MTKRQLNMQQAGWAEYLSRFQFVIRYRSGKANGLADALSRQEGILKAQKQVRDEYRQQTILAPNRLDPEVKAEIFSMEVSSLDPEISLIDRILIRNRQDPALDPLRMLARTKENSDWKLVQGLLLHKDRLVVSKDNEEHLHTLLLDKIHKQPASAHPGRNKMRQLVMQRYYWKRMGSDIDRYIRNCRTCNRSHTPRDLPPGLLKPLPIPQRPWQHISMDFMSFPPDRHGYDAVFVVVDRLGKRPRSIPCTKEATAKDLA